MNPLQKGHNSAIGVQSLTEDNEGNEGLVLKWQVP
jgi:hypothetical protein